MEQYESDNQEYIRKAEEIIRQIGIPPQPQAVMDIRVEIAKPCPDFGNVARSVSKDVALSAATLKIANSPFFGRTKTDSVHHALNLLGLRNFYSIVLTSSLYDAMGCGSNNTLDKFRRHSSTVATICAFIARKFKRDLEETSYTAGLFHDCGIPLLMKKFPDYAKMADYALPSSPLETIPDNFESVIGFETNRYNTNHCVMSYMMAKSWGLSDTIRAVVLNHHDISLGALKDPDQRYLSAVLFLSEFICRLCDPDTYTFHQNAAEWPDHHRATLAELQLKPADVGIIGAEALEIMKNNEWF